MSPQPERYPYVQTDALAGEAGKRPLLPFTLSHGQSALSVSGLLDTGSTVSVLPFGIGLQLGLDWGRQTVALQLVGNLAGFEARAVLLTATVGSFAPVHLAFAWTQAASAPLLLGQVNFFMEFDVCFFRFKGDFKVRPKLP